MNDFRTEHFTKISKTSYFRPESSSGSNPNGLDMSIGNAKKSKNYRITNPDIQNCRITNPAIQDSALYAGRSEANGQTL